MAFNATFINISIISWRLLSFKGTGIYQCQLKEKIEGNIEYCLRRGLGYVTCNHNQIEIQYTITHPIEK